MVLFLSGASVLDLRDIFLVISPSCFSDLRRCLSWAYGLKSFWILEDECTVKDL